MSRHLSNKALFQTYQRCKAPGERLAQYQVAGRAAAYYNEGQVDQLQSQNELFGRLSAAQRAFVLLPSKQLGWLDQNARRRKIPYFVIDATSSRYLMVTNKLGGQCNADSNPLRELVLSKRPTPSKKVSASFENKVKLIGYDCPDEVRAGGKLKITLYFEVLSRLPSGYKLFLHFDKPASRFHGDHEPLGGKYPTQYWLPGDYITDPHEIELPLLTTGAGVYTIYGGFWLGSKRLKVVEGPNDGVNRVKIGRVRVRRGF